MLAYHCIIHRSVLCASLRKEYSDAMGTTMKPVIYPRASSAVQHPLLCTFHPEVSWSWFHYLFIFSLCGGVGGALTSWNDCASIHRKTILFLLILLASERQNNTNNSRKKRLISSQIIYQNDKSTSDIRQIYSTYLKTVLSEKRILAFSPTLSLIRCP